jgi:hypothetical protein
LAARAILIKRFAIYLNYIQKKTIAIVGTKENLF